MTMSLMVLWFEVSLERDVVSSASTVALPRVIAISVSPRRCAIFSCPIHSHAWMFFISPNLSFRLLLSLPRAMIHSYSSLFSNCVRIASNITCDHWLQQMTRICFLSVFQFTFHFSLFTFHPNTLWSICHTTSYF
jgi:hypothetical protein